MEGNVNRILLNQILLLVVVSLVNQVSGRSRFARMVENDGHETQDALPTSEGFLVVPGGTKCFKIFRGCNRTWTEAVTKCRSHGLQLAEPRDTVAVRKYIVDIYGDGATWVGARGEGVNMRWIGSQEVLPDDSPLWYTSSPGNVSRDYCLSLLTDSDSMLDKPVQPYSALECSVMLTSTLCEEVPQLPLAHPEPTAEILSTTEPILITPEPVAGRQDSLCIDKNTQCQGWADIGECQANPLYMIPNCPKACDVCDSLCLDKNTQCQGWADIGECQANPLYMIPNCPKACDICDSLCIDKNTQCQGWADIGECQANPLYMIPNCPKACDICELL